MDDFQQIHPEIPRTMVWYPDFWLVNAPVPRLPPHRARKRWSWNAGMRRRLRSMRCSVGFSGPAMRSLWGFVTQTWTMENPWDFIADFSWSDEIWMGYILGPGRFTCWMFLVNSEDGDTRRHYSYSYGLLFFHDGLFGWRYRCSEPSWFLICQWLTWVTAGWGEPSFFSWCCQLLYAHFFEFYLFLEVPNHDGWKFKLSWVLSHVSAASSYFFSSDSQLRQKRWDSVTEALLEHAKVRHARVVWAGRWIVNAQEIPPR